MSAPVHFIVEGFLSGLHGSPFQGFSVEFSEHRKYVPGDDIKDIDWGVYAKTEKYYVKKFKAETTMQGWLVVDRSASMGWTHRQELTKFEYGVSLAAALAHLMIHQQDPVGLAVCGQRIEAVLRPKATRTQLSSILSFLSGLAPAGEVALGDCLMQLATVARCRGSRNTTATPATRRRSTMWPWIPAGTLATPCWNTCSRGPGEADEGSGRFHVPGHHIDATAIVQVRRRAPEV